MVEKMLLGFWRKDALPLYHYESISKVLDKVKHYEINEDKLIPVLLKSESVSLRFIEKFCWENNHSVEWDGVDGKRYEVETVQVKDLLKAVRGQVEAEKK